jgi:hypothetical protein
VDDALDQGEAYARALELGFTVEALEHLEQLVCILHVEARSVVPNPVEGLAVQLFARDFDGG